MWLQDHPWRFRSSASLITREGSNFYNTGSRDFSRIMSVEDIRKLFGYKTLYTKEAHSSLSKKPEKNVLRIWNRNPFWAWTVVGPNLKFYKPIFRSVELVFRSIEPGRFWILLSTALNVLKSWLVSPWALSNNTYRF